MRLFGYAPQNGAAAGDTMPFWHEGRWHLFFSQPPRDAWEYVERARVSTAHLVSDDLVNWEVLPDSFGPGVDGSCDGNGIWTGSLIEHEGISISSTLVTTAMRTRHKASARPSAPTSSTGRRSRTIRFLAPTRAGTRAWTGAIPSSCATRSRIAS